MRRNCNLELRLLPSSANSISSEDFNSHGRLNMRRNCNLELRLLPSSANSISSEDFNSHGHNIMGEYSSVSPQNHHHQQQQLTIFYDGKICVCDVTEFQARAILLVASREMDERMKTPRGSDPSLESQLYSPMTGLSMKRSLQRFLQKRNHRSLATSPY